MTIASAMGSAGAGFAGSRPHVLVVDDHVPARALGAGFPRCIAVLEALAQRAGSVTFCAMQEPIADAGAIEVLPAGVRVLPQRGALALASALDARPGVLWISRPDNLALVAGIARRDPARLAGWRIVYDAEAVFALREIARCHARGESVSDFQRLRLLRQELRPAEIAHAIVAVSRAEADAIMSCIATRVQVASMAVSPTPTSRAWEDRRHLLFIGPVTDRDSPNGDGLAHFVEASLPAIGDGGVRLRVAGRGAVPGSWLDRLGSPFVDLLGPRDDVEPLYDEALALVVPLRFGAGIPIKILHAAQRGLPVIATSLAAAQLGWRHAHELYVADGASAQAVAVRELVSSRTTWMALREGALAAIARDHAPERFTSQISAAPFGDAAA